MRKTRMLNLYILWLCSSEVGRFLNLLFAWHSADLSIRACADMEIFELHPIWSRRSKRYALRASADSLSAARGQSQEYVADNSVNGVRRLYGIISRRWALRDLCTRFDDVVLLPDSAEVFD